MERRVAGEVPPKHHIAFRGVAGELRWEECLTRDGFEGPYSILYHVHRPHEHRVVEGARAGGLQGYAPPAAAGGRSATTKASGWPAPAGRRSRGASTCCSTRT